MNDRGVRAITNRKNRVEIRKDDEKHDDRAQKARKIYWFSLRFKHSKKFETISKHRPLTAPQPQALSDNSPKKFNVFLA